jgi:DNA repair photolyase
MKTFNGKAIYNPSGKAGEYSYWACNFYVGCSNGCTYCYLRKGVLAHAMGGDTPTLKNCFRDEAHALEIFEKELKANLPELQKHGLFFSFSTDPMLPTTSRLTICAADLATWYGVSCIILTKEARWVLCHKDDFSMFGFWGVQKRCVAFGFTLTGHDELEPNASTNAERIEAMRQLHNNGFKTWASIEPVIDFDSSLDMIIRTRCFCDLYKIGLESGKKYDKFSIRKFKSSVLYELYGYGNKIYFEDGLLKAAGIRREDLPANCVWRDYNIFNN